MAKTLKIRQIVTHCPHCRAKISTDPINSGRCILCPTCAEPLQIPHDLPCPVGESYIVPTILVILPILASIAGQGFGLMVSAIVGVVFLAMIAGHIGAILRRLRHLEELSATLPRHSPEPPADLPPES